MKSIKQKLLYSHLTIAVIGTIFFIISLSFVIWMRNGVHKLTFTKQPELIALNTIDDAVNHTLINLQRFINQKYPELDIEINNLWEEKVWTNLQQLENSLNEHGIGANIVLLNQLKTSLSDLYESEWKIRDLAKLTGNDYVTTVYQTDIAPITETIITIVNDLFTIETQTIREKPEKQIIKYMANIRIMFEQISNKLLELTTPQIETNTAVLFHMILDIKTSIDKLNNYIKLLEWKERDLFRMLKAEISNIVEIIPSFVVITNSENSNVALKLFNNEALTIQERVNDIVNNLTEVLIIESLTHSRKILYICDIFVIIDGILTVSIFIVAFFISKSKSRTILNPILELVNNVSNYTPGIEVKEVTATTNDEISILAKSFNEMNKSVFESYNRLHGLIDCVSDAIIMIDKEGTIKLFNPAAKRIFGYSDSEVIGNNVKMLMPEPYYSEHDEYINHHLSTGECKIIGMSGREEKAKKKDGTIFPVDLSVNRITLKNDISFVGIVRDITVRKKIEEELIISKESAEHANMAKSKFLAQMSHELRTPLNSILGFSQLLLIDRDQTLTSVQKENVNRINKSGTHLLELINEILDLARIESENIKVVIEQINLPELVEEVIHLSSSFENKNRVKIINKIKKDKNLLIKADKTRLKQVIVNLITNAIKYNCINGTVTLSTKTIDNKRLRFNVQDTGTGIHADKYSELFEPFNRLGADKTEIKGTGLGLSIAKKLVTSMKGKIGLSSTVDKGSIFYIELPVSKEMNTPDSVPVAKQINVEEGHILILYIEDNSTNLEVVKQMLDSRKNITMISATDANIGIEMAKKQHPDLIIMDINLPGIDGTEAFKMLKNENKTKDIPVIALSANAMQKDIDLAINIGFNDYVTKPVNLKTLFEVIDKFI